VAHAIGCLITRECGERELTQYESLSIRVSVIAIIVSVAIPLVQFIYRKMQRPVVSVIPFDVQPLILNYDRFGSYVRFCFSIQCEKQACVVKSIGFKAERLDGGSSYEAKWIQLKPIFANWMFAGPQQASISSATLVHPIKVDEGKLEPLNVEFEAHGGKGRQHLLETLVMTIDCACKEQRSVEEVLSEQSVSAAIDELGKECLWQEGEYVAEISVKYDAKGLLTQRYRFRIDAAQAIVLRDNARVMAGLVVPADIPGMRRQLQPLCLDVEPIEGK